jgi:ABC-type lipoprotein export system ATPase subunit
MVTAGMLVLGISALSLLRGRGGDGRTVLVITHDTTMLQGFDRALELREGRIGRSSQPVPV